MRYFYVFLLFAKVLLGDELESKAMKIVHELDFSLDAFKEGLKKEDLREGRNGFLKTWADYRKKIHQKKVQANLVECQKIFAELKNVRAVVKDKLYYELVKQGILGKDLVEKEKFHIICRRFQQEPFIDTRADNKPIYQNLKTAIPGFSKGVEGMLVGERRILYIHPDLSFGKYNRKEPCSLLVIDVERV